MKKKDFFVVGIIVFISAIMSFVVSGSLFGGSKRTQQVEVVEVLSTDFKQPDPRYFNSEAFDPTKLITIGNSASTDPFGASARH